MSAICLRWELSTPENPGASPQRGRASSLSLLDASGQLQGLAEDDHRGWLAGSSSYKSPPPSTWLKQWLLTLSPPQNHQGSLLETPTFGVGLGNFLFKRSGWSLVTCIFIFISLKIIC